MKRLAILALAKPDNGGVFQYTLTMLKALHRLPNWQITLYRSEDDAHYSDFNFPTRHLPSSRQHALITSARERLGLKSPDPFSDQDIVLAPLYSPHLLLTGRPFAYTLHDLQERHLPRNFSTTQRLWRAYIQKRIADRASRIICESAFVHDDIVKFLDVPSTKIAIMQAPPLWQGSPLPDTQAMSLVRAKYELPAQFLFYPAQFWRHKNHAKLIEAFARIGSEFPHIHLVLTGRKRYEYNRIMRKIKILGLEKRIFHLDYVADEDMMSFYRLSCGLVMPSLFESISIPIYEAFRALTPVCASGILGMKDQVGNAGLTFDPLSIDSIASSMRRLLGDAALRKLLIERGAQALEAMTYERYAMQLESMLERMTVR